MIVYTLVYAVGVAPASRLKIPSLGPYTLSPVPYTLLIWFMTSSPDSVHTEKSSTVMFSAGMRSLARR